MKPTPPTFPSQRYINAQGAAQYLGLTHQALYNLVARRHVPFRKMGKKLVFDVRELDEYMAQLDGIGATEAVERILGDETTLLN